MAFVSAKSGWLADIRVGFRGSGRKIFECSHSVHKKLGMSQPGISLSDELERLLERAATSRGGGKFGVLVLEGLMAISEMVEELLVSCSVEAGSSFQLTSATIGQKWTPFELIELEIDLDSIKSPSVCFSLPLNDLE